MPRWLNKAQGCEALNKPRSVLTP